MASDAGAMRRPEHGGGRHSAGDAGASLSGVSLWTVCWRSHRQYFFISMRSRSFTLFFVVM